MALYKNIEEYNKVFKKNIRLKQNREIDLIVKNSILDQVIDCECGSKDFKQAKRGTYIIQCNVCQLKYKLVD